MEDFRQQFLLESAKTLKKLKENLSKYDFFLNSERREILRQIHTIKGSAQTLGFSSAGRLAHELENLLSAAKNANGENIFRRYNIFGERA